MTGRPFIAAHMLVRVNGGRCLPDPSPDTGARKSGTFNPRLDGPAVHKRIGFNPPIDWVDLAAKAIIVAGLGACVAMWLS